MKGMIVYSFASCAAEPNPCNIRLARAAERIIDTENERLCLVVQWEIWQAIRTGLAAYIVQEHREGNYLDSEEVTAQAAEIFRSKGIKEVIPVAQPFLLLPKCRWLIRQAGFNPVRRRIGWIGFYHRSKQWWTRGPIRLLVYAALQLMTGRRGR